MDMNSLSDTQLVALASKKHLNAQVALYQRYADRMYGFFVAHVNNSHDAEDLTQETFIRALSGLHNFRGVASFKNWLYAIAKNELADFYRNQHAHVLELDEALPPRNLQKHLGDEELLMHEQKKSMRLVSRIFGNLPERYKKILTLRFLKGFSLKETASAMSLSLSNTKVLQHRALKMARMKSETML